MKSLYEVTNGFMGTSYVRCYVWADSEEQALSLATEAYKADKPWMNLSGRLQVEKLFSADAESFCTNPSSDGWEIDG